MNIRCAAMGLVFLGIFPSAGQAQVPKPAKNLLDNGDFSAGIQHWKGDGKADVFKPAPVISATPQGFPAAATPAPPRPPMGGGTAGKPDPDGDRSYCVTLGARSQTFFQSFAVPRKTKVLKLTYRVRSTDGFLTSRTALRAFQVKFLMPDRSFLSNDETLGRTPDWQTFHFNHTLKEQIRGINLVIEVYPGAGQLYFDDFVLEAVE